MTLFKKISIQTVDDFIHGSFDIILEADELNLSTANTKLILCIPYHYDDPVSKECKKAIKQIIDNKIWIEVRINFSK